MGQPKTQLAKVCDYACRRGADSIEVKFDHGRLLVYACSGNTGIATAHFSGASREGKELLKDLYGAARRPASAMIAGHPSKLYVSIREIGKAFTTTVKQASPSGRANNWPFTSKQGRYLAYIYHCGRSMEKFPRFSPRRYGIEGDPRAIHFMQALSCIDPHRGRNAGVVAGTVVVGKAKVGGIDLNKLRMRGVAEAILALSWRPDGFTSWELADQVAKGSRQSKESYHSRQAAYDLKWLNDLSKLRSLKKAMARGLALTQNTDYGGVVHHQVDVHVLEYSSGDYREGLCIFGLCPKVGKRECLVSGCGAQPFRQRFARYRFQPTRFMAAPR
jgi:hypothetical protein